MEYNTSNALCTFLTLDLVLAPLSGATCGIGFVIWHPPWAAVAGGFIVAALMFVKPFDQMIAMADVEAAG